ncbi:MAG: methyltransferase [Methanomassiliicoccus sp.]|nr:methyltransferase [Methanomassiliicoccus sp.]
MTSSTGDQKERKLREFWAPYWNKRTDGWHKDQSEDFLQKEAREKMFHMGGGESLLDFGCGSGDLLQYMAPHYREVTGVDFSENMLKVAREKMDARCGDRVRLILGDDVTFWDSVQGQSFDRIIMVGVVQYLLLDQLNGFLERSHQHLADGGKIILFDVADARLAPLFKVGFFNYDQPLVMVPYQYVRNLSDSVRRKIRGGPWSHMNFLYAPNEIVRVANDLDFDAEVVRSTYYEYRYHVILTERRSDGPMEQG